MTGIVRGIHGKVEGGRGIVTVVRRSLLLVALLLSAGCVGLQQEPADGTGEAPTRNAVSRERMGDDPTAAPLPQEPRALAVNLTVVDRWVRPQDEVAASVTSAGASTFEWFLVSRNPVVAAAPSSGGHAHGADGSHTGSAAASSVDTGDVAPGDSSVPVSLGGVGRVVLASRAGGPPAVGIVLNRSLPTSVVDVFAVANGSSVRFIPSEVTAGVGSQLVLHNRAGSSARLQQVEIQSPLGVSGQSVRFSMPSGLELGEYDVIVVARSSNDAAGAASERLIYDRRKPDANQTFGPWRGEFRASGLPPDVVPPAEHGFESKFAFQELTIGFEASSEAPAGAKVVVRLFDASGDEIWTSAASGADGVTLRGLPAGAYVVRVEPAEGVMVSYELKASGVLLLVPPASFFNQ